MHVALLNHHPLLRRQLTPPRAEERGPRVLNSACTTNLLLSAYLVRCHDTVEGLSSSLFSLSLSLSLTSRNAHRMRTVAHGLLHTECDLFRQLP
jgi:hypothetical protein